MNTAGCVLPQKLESTSKFFNNKKTEIKTIFDKERIMRLAECTEVVSIKMIQLHYNNLLDIFQKQVLPLRVDLFFIATVANV